MEPLQRTDPRRIGPHEVLARLGAGGMGQVFLARSRSGRHVAIKLVQESLADDPEFRARFKREVAAARAVSGAFTAPVIDADPDARVPWLATAFLPGLSLQRAVAEGGPLPIPDARLLGANLAEALLAIHRAGVVHRDLKPSNVLLTPEGPRVIDFGIARAADATAVTRTGSVVGSPGYMAPEQATGGDAGPAGDVFALGAVLTYAVTGRGPFGQGPAEVLLYRVVHSEPDLSGVGDAELRELIAACLDKRPERRPAPDVVLARLAPSGGGTPLSAEWLRERVGEETVPQTALLPPEPEPEPSRRAVLAVAGGVLALGVAAFGATRYLLGREQDPEPATATPRTSTTPSALPAHVIWHSQVPHGRLLNAPIAVAGNLLFVLTSGSGIHVLDARSGEPLWRAELRPAAYSAAFRPLVREGVAYLQDSSAITAYDAASGRIRWTRSLQSGVVHAWPVSVRGHIVTCSEKEVVAYDPVTGEVRWTWSPSSRVDRPQPWPVAFDGAVLVETDRWMYALDGDDGRVRWKHDLGIHLPQAAPVVADGTAYLARQDGLRAWHAGTGKLRWRVPTPDRKTALTHGPVVADRTVYLAGPDALLYAFEAGTGKQRWKVRLAGDEKQRERIESAGLAPVTAIGLVYVNDCNENLLALDGGTGKIRWQQPIPGTPPLVRPVVTDAAIHVTTREGVRSFSLDSGRILRTVPYPFHTLGRAPELIAGKDALYLREGASVAALRP